MKETRIISLGAGVQSTAVALLAVHGEIPPVEHAVFADTGWEPKEVYDHFNLTEEKITSLIQKKLRE